MTRRVVDFDAVRAEAARRSAEVRLKAGLGIPKDQEHDDAHWEAQLLMDRARLQSWLASGKLIIHDRRHWELT
jgi:hypothetical protein